MSTTTQNPTLTSREFFRSPAKIASMLSAGRRITVTRRGKELFEAVPKKVKKGMTLKDFKYMQFSDPKGDPNLSKKVDEIVYG